MVQKVAEWRLNGCDVNVFEIESNYIVRVYQEGKCVLYKVYKKDFLHRLGSVYKDLEKELSSM